LLYLLVAWASSVMIVMREDDILAMTGYH
jgi:hypothetical protein